MASRQSASRFPWQRVEISSKLGENLDQAVNDIRKQLPLGLEIHQVSNQPKVVKDSIGEFIRTLCEAIVIVLFVSFLSLGVRTGLVVACCIPLVIAGVFVAMDMLSIDLHKVSLGALIIALGLLVDDAIIAVEMMSVKLEQGYDRFKAACYAYTATALPMLTGTLITCAGFIPVGFSEGSSAEFTSALFPVITILVDFLDCIRCGCAVVRLQINQSAGTYGRKNFLYE